MVIIEKYRTLQNRNLRNSIVIRLVYRHFSLILNRLLLKFFVFESFSAVLLFEKVALLFEKVAGPNFLNRNHEK